MGHSAATIAEAITEQMIMENPLPIEEKMGI
jgi:hypothetical protein